MNSNEALTSLGPFNRFMSGPIRAVLAASGFLSVALWICAALPTTRVTASDLGFALLVTLVFVLAELFPAEIEIRRESIRFSFSVVPLILALFGLPALLVVAARSAASVLTFFVIRREVWFKSYSNVASQILEVAVAAILISSFRPPGAFGVGSWLLAGCAVLAVEFAVLSAAGGVAALDWSAGCEAAAPLDWSLLGLLEDWPPEQPANANVNITAKDNFFTMGLRSFIQNQLLTDSVNRKLTLPPYKVP